MITAKRALALTTAALVPMLAIVFFLSGHADKAAGAASPAKASAPAAPSAATFAAEFIGVTNQYAQEHRVEARTGKAHCVQAAPGHYMCSYVVTKRGRSTCHLMQARWTPERASTITVTLAGRTARCATLREAIRTLG